MQFATVTLRVPYDPDRDQHPAKWNWTALARGRYSSSEPIKVIEDVYDLILQVREHEDFVFGAMFKRSDFPDNTVPADFEPRDIEDVLVERGNAYISEQCDTEEEEV